MLCYTKRESKDSRKKTVSCLSKSRISVSHFSFFDRVAHRAKVFFYVDTKRKSLPFSERDFQCGIEILFLFCQGRALSKSVLLR